MNDLISRQAAIDAVRRLQTYKLSEGDDMLLVDKAEVQTKLMMLPSARRKGKWKHEKMKHIINGEVRDVMICSVCDAGWFRYDISDNTVRCVPNFCPNCGAEMKGEEDETD